MKLILSRKGFDSSAGGVPSPILPDGRLVVLPIPDAQSSIPYGAISHAGEPLGPLVADLTRGRITADTGAHLDPDLTRESLPRQPGWRPVFGQMGQALGHLRNQGVGPGDLFLFFGLFRRVERVGGCWRWVGDAAPCHVLWGWMQVAETLSLREALPASYAWAGYHPHCQRQGQAANALYLARRHLCVGSDDDDLPGAGIFARYAARRRLTAVDAPRVSDWDLPDWWYPGEGRAPLSYHGDLRRWRRAAGRTALRAVARGQEFVLDTEQYPEALPWARELIRRQAN
ncbi:hypothetical protein [Halomonas caseinilytica]|uniref:Nmad3 family putative nucleotide modification protein n=1 Tax=Halomonas caseinilytica TaxID=438744 RepID=UPI0008491D13|nr:hypothetical protein [Halomonas caseinilytica]